MTRTNLLYHEQIPNPENRFHFKLVRGVIDLREEPVPPYAIILPDGTETTPKELVTRLLSLEERIAALEAAQRPHVEYNVTPPTEQ